MCYQVPAFMVAGLTLVVTPLVSLMEDQVARALQVGLRAACMSATQSAEERTAVGRRVAEGRLDVLFVSPERFEISAFREALRGTRVDLLAIDEAHCISEWGHDFRPAYRRLDRVRRSLACPTLALTASATPEVRADIRRSLLLRDPLEIVKSFDRPNLCWAIIPGVRPRVRSRSVYHLLRGAPGCAIVYAPTRRAVEVVRDDLAARGVRCASYHAGLTGPERSRVQGEFMTGAVRVVVATNAFGMGIDKSDVRTVVHTQLPGTLEAYYQEAGRAGRDGEPSRCIAFHSRADRSLVDGFIDRTHPSVRVLRRLHATLRKGADADGVVRVEHPAVTRALGGAPRGWLSGEPEGPLAALERTGALRRLDPAGQGDRIGVRRAPDFAAATAHRQRARAKLASVQRLARTRGCRIRALLRYFGEDAGAHCGRCDRCGWTMESGLHLPDGSI